MTGCGRLRPSPRRGPELAGTFVVTGAGGGMGSAAALQLVERGANVLAVDWRPEGLDALREKLGSPDSFDSVTADVASAEEVEAYVARTVERWGGLDGVFNIAGIGTGEFKPLAEVSNETYHDEVMRVNARSAWLGMKYSLPHLVARGGGVIVNTGSHLASHAAPTFSAYTASKHAVVGMTKAVALEYGRDNVRANIVCPSAMDTAMGQEAAEGIDPDDPSVGWQVMIDQSANGRVAPSRGDRCRRRLAAHGRARARIRSPLPGRRGAGRQVTGGVPPTDNREEQQMGSSTARSRSSRGPPAGTGPRGGAAVRARGREGGRMRRRRGLLQG